MLRPVIPAALSKRVANNVILFGGYETDALSGKWRQLSACVNSSCTGFVESRPQVNTPVDDLIEVRWPAIDVSNLRVAGAGMYAGTVTFKSKQAYPTLQAFVDVQSEVYCQAPQRDTIQGRDIYRSEVTLLPATRPSLAVDSNVNQVFILDDSTSTIRLTLLINGVVQTSREIKVEN